MAPPKPASDLASVVGELERTNSLLRVLLILQLASLRQMSADNPGLVAPEVDNLVKQFGG